MHVLALAVDLHVGAARSLKQKRAVIRPIVEGARRRYEVAAAEVAFQDQWQRARLGFTVVSSSVSHAEEVAAAVERFVWSHPEVEVLEVSRSWLVDDEAPR